MKGKYPNGLKAAMKAIGIKPVDLAKAVDTAKQNVSRLADGERELTRRWAELFAPELNVDPESLIFFERPAIRIPVLSWVAAGRLTETEPVKLADAKKTILVSDLPANGDWVGLEVQGDSMDRIAPEGAMVVVNRNDVRLHDERFYVVQLPDGRATFKRYRVHPTPHLQPFSTNPDHATQYLEEGMQVFGRVRRVIHDLK